jgi:hypothetical protein
MKHSQKILVILISCSLLASCYVISVKGLNELTQNKAFDMNMDKFHQQSMQTRNLDSLYCNLNMVMETLAYFKKDLKKIQFSNKGIEKVKNELIKAYEGYKMGYKNNFQSEWDLKERISEYLTWVIEDEKLGKKNYENKSGGLWDRSKDSQLHP